jgi:hypothetical protein
MANYSSKWSKDYADLADAVLVASGEKFPVHAAVLNSPMISGLVNSMKGKRKRENEIAIQADVVTVKAILEMVYRDDFNTACDEAAFTELFDTLDFLGCETLLTKLFDRLGDSMRAWAYGWEVEKYAESRESAFFYDSDGVALAKQTERMGQLCAAILGHHNLELFGKTSFYDKPLNVMVWVVRDVFLKSRPGWWTLMSQPHWNAVPGSRLAKFVAAVTTMRGHTDLSLHFPEPVTVKVRVTLEEEDFTRLTTKSIDLDSEWSVKCSNTMKNGQNLHNFEVRVVCNQTRGYSRIEARLSSSTEPFDRVILCCGKDFPYIPGWRIDSYVTQNLLGFVDKSFEVEATITPIIH